ncbi:sulfotransferase family protein [Rhodobacterales bacterium HKCCE3408]|nr:sulfotransferase family protein [Rhodobacterales bacterium HKCCE3408]
MTLRVIGAGFGRTGTESMKTALEILGFGPCHHMYEVLSDKQKCDSWLEVLDGGADPDWDRLLDGYTASVDWPVALYWRSLAERFPQAKILLTTRDRDSWYASMDRTILQLMRDPDNNRMADALARRVFPDGVSDSRAILNAYDRNEAEVRAAFGPDRLLVHAVGDGWPSLCAFLGCAVPDVPFPHANEGRDFLQRDRDLDARRGE